MYASCTGTRKGYSLLQLVVTLGIVAVLMATAIKSYAIARSGAMAGICAGKLKILAMDLERYRADYRCYPATIEELYPRYTQSAEAFRCPEDGRAGAFTYSDFYIPRSKKDKGEGRLLLTCPFHQDAGKGVELFFDEKNSHERGKTCVATLSGGGGSISVLPYDAARPDAVEPTDPAFWNNAIAAVPNMDVGPGDWIRVTAGTATLTFKDQSRAEITAPTEIMVVDAFRTAAGEQPSVFYTALRLARGQVYNIVTHGSKYEVITPTGTAGAKGTEFQVVYTPDTLVSNPLPPPANGKAKGHYKQKAKGKAETNVVKGVVYMTGRFGTVELYPGDTSDVEEDGNVHKNKGNGKNR